MKHCFLFCLSAILRLNIACSCNAILTFELSTFVQRCNLRNNVTEFDIPVLQSVQQQHYHDKITEKLSGFLIYKLPLIVGELGSLLRAGAQLPSAPP